MNKAIGRCSHCGGTVTVPSIWHGLNAPVPRCENCGATASNRHLPVIDMDPPGTPVRDVELSFIDEILEILGGVTSESDKYDEWGHPRRYTKGGW